MFKVKIGRKEVEIKFTHFNPVVTKDISNYGTTCFFLVNGKLTEYGSSHLHPLDYSSYCKETGRKLALTRALKHLGLTKRERTKVWEAYFAAQDEARGLALTQEMYKQ